MKKCPKCEINYIDDNEELCSVCRQPETNSHKSFSNKCNTNTSKLSNPELRDKKFYIDLNGYYDYLIARKYTIKTSIDYRNAIDHVCENEFISFKNLFNNAEYYVNLYGPNGEKSEYGKIGHNTWISALKRLKEFKEFINYYSK